MAPSFAHAGAPPAGAPPTTARPPRFDRLELALLASFAAASAWVLGLDLWQVLANGRVWTGTDGSFIVDQMQYLAWIVSASRHVLVSDLFVLHTTPADYFQPAIAISGVLTDAGVPPTLALLLWKPVAVVSLFFAVRAYAYRGLGRSTRAQRLAVITLALFFGSFTVLDGGLSVLGDLFPAFLSWGYPFALMAVAAVIFALLAYDRARAAGSFSWTPSMLGVLAGLLHPWQGELFILIILGAELMSLPAEHRRAGPAGGLRVRALLRSEHARLLAATVGATLVPLVYYAALGKLDITWQLAQLASKHSFPALTLLGAVAPIVLVAALGYRRRPEGFLDRATRVWPPAAALIYLVSSTTLGATPLHAFDGVTIPLALLAVSGYRTLRIGQLRHRRALGAALVLIGTLPATIYEMASERGYVAPAAGNPNFITHDESRALAFLRHDHAAGGVMTRFYLGSVVPARTGRATYVGDCIWSQPGCGPRAIFVQRLLDGGLAPQAAQALVAGSHARFVLADCDERADLFSELGAMITSVQHFGCATVYAVRAPALPESTGYAAAVRASRGN